MTFLAVNVFGFKLDHGVGYECVVSLITEFIELVTPLCIYIYIYIYIYILGCFKKIEVLTNLTRNP